MAGSNKRGIVDVVTVDENYCTIDGRVSPKVWQVFPHEHGALIAGDGEQIIALLGSAVDGVRPTTVDSLVALLLAAVGLKLRETVTPEDFGGSIQSALDSGAKRVSALASAYTITETLVVPDSVELCGSGINATNIIIAADVVGVRTGQQCRLRGFKLTKTGTHTKNGIEVGSVAATGARSGIQDVRVEGMGNDGIVVVNGNLGSMRDVACISNGRDGVNFTLDTEDTNSWKLEGFLDLRSNVRDGLHFAMGTSASDASAPKAHSVDLVVAQSNGRYGVYVGTRSNHIVAYCESNTTAQVFLDTYANGNEIRTVEGAVTDSSNKPESNLVQNFNSNASYERVFQNKTVFTGGVDKGLRVSNNDGTAGYFDIEKTAAREAKFKFQGSGGTWNVTFENTSSGQTLDGNFGGNWRPLTDATYLLGHASRRWSQAYVNALVLKPAASVTPASNGDVVWELTNDTTLTAKAKGSDGVVRSVAWTLAPIA